MEEMVTISAEYYSELLERDQWLSALECAGVDNWDGIEVAAEMLQEWDNEHGEND